jgi:hypothetical protein
MSAKRQQMVWSFLWDTLEDLENGHPLVALCSAGILLLSEMSDEQLAQLVKRTKKLRNEYRKKIDARPLIRHSDDGWHTRF